MLIVTFPVHLFAQSTMFDASWSAASIRYVSDCIIACLTAAALRRFELSNLVLNNLGRTLIFAGVTSGSVALASLLAQWNSFLWSGGRLWPSWSLLFLSNFLPFLIATPCLVIGLSRGFELVHKVPVARWVEFVFLAAILLVGGTTVFGVVPQAIGSVPALFFLPLPFLLWAAVRFGAGGLSFNFVIFSLMAIFNTVGGLGPFVTQSAADSVFRLQVFLLSLYVPLLVLASVVEDHRMKEGALKRSEARYRAIVEDQTELICRFRPDGTYTFVNDAYGQYFGRRPEELLGQTFWQFIPSDGHQAARDFLASFTPEHSVSSREHEVLVPGGEMRWQQWRDRAFFDAAGRVVEFQAVGRDITERKQAEAALRESEERFRVLADLAPVMVWMSGPDKLWTDFNRPWLEFTGRPIEAELGNGWAEGVHPDDLDECFKTYSTAFDKREPFRMEYRLRRHDGEYRWILDGGIPRTAPDGSFEGYIGSAVDVTEQKRAQAALANLNHRLMEAHEQERTRIARELHDDICQRVALMTMQLQALSRELPSDQTEARARIREVSTWVRELGSDIQAISHQLHSSKLDHIGIARAAAAFCEEMCVQHYVEIDFLHHEVPANLPHQTAIGLFRVLQEALTNAIKHSGVRRFTVTLRRAANEIQLEVIDRGIGFDPEAALKTRGLGLISMRERLSLIHGRVFVESRVNGGTTIRASVPIAGSGEETETARNVRTQNSSA
jgi:PAS domain S-box-containing protein